MRIFNIVVFEQQVVAGTYYSDPSFNDRIASAEKILVEVISENVSGTITMWASLEHSNDNRTWPSTPKTDLVGTTGTPVTLSSPTDTRTGQDTGANVTGAFARIRLVFANTGNARIRVIVCGRAEQASN